MKLELPIALRHIKSRYYKTLGTRVSSKTRRLAKPEKDKEIIARLKAELAALAFKFRTIFDSSRSYYIILSKEMIILDYNRASLKFVKKLFGKKMVIGDNILDFLHPASIKIVTDNCNTALGGEKLVVERKVCYLDKSISWWSFEFSPTTNLRGGITGLVFNANDITKRKAYEDKIQVQHEKLVEIASLQSHEVRGPVSTIMGLMSLIKDENYQSNKEYLLLLEITADLLDKNIRDIVAKANDD
jgi:PAS domain S-box-containing protein